MIPELTMGTSGGALVPYDHDFANVANVFHRYRVRILLLTKGMTKAAVAMGKMLLPAMQATARAMADLVLTSRAAGLIPPFAATQRHGTRWTGLDGTVLIVRGRRNRPHTYHWGEPGPHRWRHHG